MQRSRSGIVRASRSVLNVGKPRFDFSFVLNFERLENFASSAATGDIVVVWERSKKSLATAPVPTSPTSRTIVFSEREKLSGDVQIIKEGRERFQEKEYKISVRQGNAKGKSLGHAYLDFAKFAEVPTGSRIAELQLSNESVLVVLISSKFKGRAKRKEVKVEEKAPQTDLDGLDGDDPIDDAFEADDDFPPAKSPEAMPRSRSERVQAGPVVVPHREIPAKDAPTITAASSSAAAAAPTPAATPAPAPVVRQVESVELAPPVVGSFDDLEIDEAPMGRPSVAPIDERSTARLPLAKPASRLPDSKGGPSSRSAPRNARVPNTKPYAKPARPTKVVPSPAPAPEPQAAAPLRRQPSDIPVVPYESGDLFAVPTLSSIEEEELTQAVRQAAPAQAPAAAPAPVVVPIPAPEPTPVAAPIPAPAPRTVPRDLSRTSSISDEDEVAKKKVAPTAPPRARSHSGTEWLRRRNAALRAENEELKARIKELELWKEAVSGADESSLLQANEALHMEIDELKQKLAREPVYQDVLQELKQTKIALALMQMEHAN